MGTVWRAEHLTLRSPVAIKLLGAEIARYPEAMERFLREAQAAAALRSPHVVQVLDYGEDHGVAFIAMELLEGESLGARLRRSGHLSPAETSKLLGEVARALQRAHEAKIVHRDLKPDNIFIVRDQENELAKVLDFGIAKGGVVEPTHQTRGGMRLGTPDYMSPEQVSAAVDVDFRSDLWAFGVIAFECLTGKHPFERELPEQLFYAICSGPLPVPSEHGAVPRGFDAWFKKACSRDPKRRFASATEAATELAQVCTSPSVKPRGQTQLAPEVKAKTAPVRRTRRTFEARRRLWAVVAMSAAFVSVAVVGFLVAQEQFGWGRHAPIPSSEPPLPPPASTPPPKIVVTPAEPSQAPPDVEATTLPPPLNPAPVGAPVAGVDRPREVEPERPAPEDPTPEDPAPDIPAPGTAPQSIRLCFKACDVPARSCERSCKSPDCNVATTCFRAEADCDLGCYRDTVAGFKSKPPDDCVRTCRELDQRCRSRTCGNSAICAKERCEPVRQDCNQICGASGRK